MLWMERIESLKAGGLGAIATGAAILLSHLLIQRLLVGIEQVGSRAVVLENLALDGELGSLAFGFSFFVAIASGFLFGVTYRYIVRQDQNSHLRSGAVSAFALVRGLAQLDQRGLDERLVAEAIRWPILGSLGELPTEFWSELLTAAVLLAESWLLFGCARLLLDWGLSRGWLRAFG